MGLAGVQNVICKSLGSGNPFNMVKATISGLEKMQSPEEIAKLRGVPIEEEVVHGEKTVS